MEEGPAKECEGVGREWGGTQGECGAWKLGEESCRDSGKQKLRFGHVRLKYLVDIQVSVLDGLLEIECGAGQTD